MFIITIIVFIPINQQPEQDRLAENQPTAVLLLSILNHSDLYILAEYENDMIK